MRHYPEIAGQYHAGCTDLTGVIPIATKAIRGLLMDGPGNDALSAKSEELVAFVITITARYDDCMAHRSQVVIKPDFGRLEAIKIIGVEFLMEGGPSMLCSFETVRTDDQFARIKQWNLTARVLMCFEIKNPIEL